MTGAKFNIEKFDGTGDYVLWRIKMRGLLIQHGCEAALEVLPMDMEAEAKAELNKKAHSAVILCLGNKVLRKVTGEMTAAGVWSKLETLYMKKKTNPWPTSCTEEEDVKFEDEDLALLLLTSLPASYEHFVDTLLYGREALTLEDVMTTLNSKEIKERSKAKGDDGEGLYLRGRTDRKDSRQSRGKSRSKSRGERLKCYICQYEDHLKRNYPKNNRKKSTGYVKKDEQPSSSGSTYDYSECTVGYILELKRNLISLGTLEKEGYTVKMQSGKVKVINGSMVILSGIRRDNCVYSLDGHAMAGAGKAGTVWQEKYRRVWVYILRFKHEAFGKFKEWNQLVENQTRRMVKKLRTDNGLDFCNREFEQLCIKSGIARHLTISGTTQQNGVAKRMNRTLMDKVRCLLIQSGLPKTCWTEATCTTAYLINRSPSRAIEKKTPMEMWLGHPSDYGMLRIFGCVAYPHDKQGKLKPRAVKCILLGYPKGVKGYRLYRLDGESPKIVTIRNVVFNESVMYKDMLKDSGAGDKSVEELHVEVELQRLNNHTPEEDQKDQEDGDDEDARDQETDQPPDLTDYQLVRDRETRTRTKPLSSKWKAAMKEEMDSLRKNKTWELVDHPGGQKLVSCKWLFKIKEWIEGVQKPRYKARNLEEVIYMRQPPRYEQGNKVCLLKKSLYGLKQSPRQWYRRFDEYMLSNEFKCSSYDSCVYYMSYAPVLILISSGKSSTVASSLSSVNISSGNHALTVK
ncbi:retrotransposon protein, putative, ty1-copia subclass [Tanacetum coccineum]|uniref:Retrotransposon protein, putative, ty1-copia subclass n=1 Tax=Tanacetum coccineum TaxID=301880 RepID=A0ABQ5DSZ0_9ASTR